MATLNIKRELMETVEGGVERVTRALAAEGFGVLPCNVVVREVAPGRLSVECALPSAMMRILGDERLTTLATQADTLIARALKAA